MFTNERLFTIQAFTITRVHRIFDAKIEISGTEWVEKTPIYIFSTFRSKINEFERKKLEKNEKIPKT